METLEWNELLATGIKEIDEQHKRIVEIVNQLRDAIERGEAEAADVALLQMLDYTIYHFEYEETLLEKSGYYLLPLHRRVHQLFIRRIPEFQRRYAAGENVLHEVHEMLARWLVHHIQNDDRGYAPTVKAYLMREAQQNPSHYSNTSPLPLQEIEPPAKENPRSWRKLWSRLSSFLSEDV